MRFDKLQWKSCSIAKTNWTFLLFTIEHVLYCDPKLWVERICSMENIVCEYTLYFFNPLWDFQILNENKIIRLDCYPNDSAFVFSIWTNWYTTLLIINSKIEFVRKETSWDQKTKNVHPNSCHRICSHKYALGFNAFMKLFSYFWKTRYLFSSQVVKFCMDMKKSVISYTKLNHSWNAQLVKFNSSLFISFSLPTNKRGCVKLGEWWL